MLARREDVQWLRAVAIGAVVGFHTRADLWPLGFLGVDVFFVLSGFLMTALLARTLSEEKEWRTAARFLGRRARRILPTYLLAVLVTLLAGRRLLLPVDAAVLTRDAVWALGLAGNLQPLAERLDYFQLTSDFRPLAHTWSLGVELQFYLVAPFLLRPLLRSRRPGVCVGVLASLSLTLQTLVPSQWAFGFTPCRLWQFLVGTAVHLLSENAKTEKSIVEQKSFYKMAPTIERTVKNDHSIAAFFLFLILLLILLFPCRPIFPFAHFLLRFVVSVITGFLLICGSDLERIFPSVIGRGLSLVGDASYSIYLIHWPVLVFARYLNFLTTSEINLFKIFAIIFVLSFLQYFLMERKLAKFSTFFQFFLIAILFLLNFTSIFTPSNFADIEKQSKFEFQNRTIGVEEAIQLNQQMALNCGRLPANCVQDAFLQTYFPPTLSGVHARSICRINLTASGNRTLVITGNSFALRHTPVVLEALSNVRIGSEFGKAYLIAFDGCPTFLTFADRSNPIFECDKLKGLLGPFLEKVNPDLLVMVNKFGVPAHYSPKNISDTLKTEFNPLAAAARRVLVIEPHFILRNESEGAANWLAHALLQSNGTLKLLTVPITPDAAWSHLKQVVEMCRHCRTLSTTPHFCATGFCSVMDSATKLSFFCDRTHFSPVGTAKLLHPLKRVLNRIRF